MLSGIILAGGESLRMDRENKSLLMLGEEALIQRQIRIMRELCSEIIIVTNNPQLFLRKVDASVRIIIDYIPGKGPLSGMHAGLTLARNRYTWVVGCDMPFLSSRAAELMLRNMNDGLDAVIPWICGVLHPLHGIYNRDCAGYIRTLLKNEVNQLSSLSNVMLWQEATEIEFGEACIDCDFVSAIKTRDDYLWTIQQLEKTKIGSG